jgi:hypothetical protein
VRQALIIQVIALFTAGLRLDGGRTSNACALASLLFWACAGLLLLWQRGRPTWLPLFFIRWGLVPFAFLGTPALVPLMDSMAPYDGLFCPLLAFAPVILYCALALYVLVYRRRCSACGGRGLKWVRGASATAAGTGQFAVGTAQYWICEDCGAGFKHRGGEWSRVPPDEALGH